MRCLNIGIISLIWLFSISGMQNSFAQHPNKIPEIEMVEVKGGAFYMGSDDSDKYAESMENRSIRSLSMISISENMK